MTTAKSERDRSAEFQEQAKRAFSEHLIFERSEGRWCIKKKNTSGKYAGTWESNYWTEIIALRGGKLLVHGDIAAVLFAQYGDSSDPERMLRWMGRCKDVDYYVTQKASIGSGKPDGGKVRDEGVMLWEIEEKIESRKAELLKQCDSSLWSDLEGVENERRADHAELADLAFLVQATMAHRYAADEEPTLPQALGRFLSNDTAEVYLSRVGEENKEAEAELRTALVDARKKIEEDWLEQKCEEDPEYTAWRDAADAVDGEGTEAALRYLQEARDDGDDLIFDCEEWCDMGMVTSPDVYFAHAALARLCDLLDEEKAAKAN